MNAKPVQNLSLDYGAAVFYRGKRHVIRQESQDFATVVLCDPETGKLVEAPIVELSPVEPLATYSQKDLSAHDEDNLVEAEKKFELIKPLLDNPGRTTQDMLDYAAKVGVHFVTLYRWLKLFETTGKVSSFARRDRTDKGKTLLAPEVEKSSRTRSPPSI